MKMSAAAVLSLLLLGCSDRAAQSANADSGGTLVIASLSAPGTLFPPLVFATQEKQVVEQIYDYLADVGPEMNTHGDRGFRAQLADSWRWSPDSMSIAFHINPAARWHDGKRADAQDVAFTFALNKDTAFGGRSESELANIDSVSVPNSQTAVFWFKARSPSQFLDAAAQLLILPAHQLKNLSPEALRQQPPPPVGTGRFRLKHWDHGSSLEIVADSSNYRGRAKLDRVIWSVTPDFNANVAKLFGGEVDLVESLRLENVRELSRHHNVRALVLPGTEYVFMAFNLRDPKAPARAHPLFADRNLRRAITMAVDRESLVQSVFDTLAEVPLGPTVRAFQSTSPIIPQIRYDPTLAASVLDSLGWSRRSPRGIRTRDGRELSFTTLVSSLSVNRMRMAVLIQEQLRKAGIEMKIEPMDNTAQVARMSARDFDASITSWRLGASLDGTRAAWTRAGLGRDGINYGSYENPLFDTQLEQALKADPVQSRPAFTRAFAIINQDAPAVWLYEPKVVLGVHKRLRTPRMRPDAWWVGLGDWSIPPAERIFRDRVRASR